MKKGNHLILMSVLSIICLLYCMMSTAPLHAADANSLRAGAAKLDITPSELAGLYGFGEFVDVHDPIFVRALVLDNGENTAAIVAVDLRQTGDTMGMRRRIERELGIPADHIMIASSHDHNAPGIGTVTSDGVTHGDTPPIEAFTRIAYDKIFDALEKARGSMQPARFGMDVGRADINVNRDVYTADRGWTLGYNPDGPSDKRVWVLKFETLSGEPIAVLFNYAVHSTMTLGINRLSGDLAGAAARFVERCYDEKAVALFTMGAAGEQVARYSVSGPRTGNSGGSLQKDEKSSVLALEAVDALGLMLGGEVVRVARNMAGMTSSVRIEAGERVLSCPTKAYTTREGMKEPEAPTMDIRLGLIMINEVAITGVSGEVVTNIYSHLMKDSPLANTIMVTLSNDRVGYIADDAAYDRPLFEVKGSPLARGCAENGIVDGLVEMINRYF